MVRAPSLSGLPVGVGRLHWDAQSTLSGPPVKRRQCKLARIRRTARRYSSASVDHGSPLRSGNHLPLGRRRRQPRRARVLRDLEPSVGSRFHPAGLHIPRFRQSSSGAIRGRAPRPASTTCSIRRPTGRPASRRPSRARWLCGRRSPTSRSRRSAWPIRPISRSCAGRTAGRYGRTRSPTTTRRSAARRSAHCRAATPGTSSRSTPRVTRGTSPASRAERVSPR